MLDPRVFYQVAKAFHNMSLGKKYFQEGKFEGLSMAEAMKLLPAFPGDSKLLHRFGEAGVRAKV
jgi:hypothetical protein